MFSAGRFKKIKNTLLVRLIAAYIALTVAIFQAAPLETAYAQESGSDAAASAESVDTGDTREDEGGDTPENAADDEPEGDEAGDDDSDGSDEEASQDTEEDGSIDEQKDEDGGEDGQGTDTTDDSPGEEDGYSGSEEPSADTDDEASPSESTPPLETSASATDEGILDDDGQDLETSTSTGGEIASDTASTTESSAVAETASSTAPIATTTEASAASSTATTSISTGDAGAASGIVNETNVNGVNSTGTVAILNDTSGEDYTLDLRDLVSSTTSTSTSLCSGCGEINIMPIDLNNSNNATITNEILTEANTGDNAATSSDAYIVTGDAAAISNIVNLANMNVINSEILLLILNKEGDWNGALIMPNADFFTRFFNGTGGIGGEGAPPGIDNSNDATVENIVNTDANTGENAIQGADGDIATGSANAFTNILNLINSNLVGGGHFELFVNIGGAWEGGIYNLPDGISYESTPTGFVLRGSSGVQSSTGSGGSVTNSNSAVIRNVVDTVANTGGNTIVGEDGSIATGDAYAATNIVNMANTNLVGENWLSAIINIGGSWNGYLAFGEPDLWIGAEAATDGDIGEGDQILYTLTLKNNGDATAHDVVLDGRFSKAYAIFDHSEEEWNDLIRIGDLRAGETKTLSYRALVNRSSDDNVSVETLFSAEADEPDANPDDNTESLSFTIRGTGEEKEERRKDYKPQITISKAAAVSATAASSTVDYTITIFNRSHRAMALDAILVDRLVDEAGNIVSEQHWELGSIGKREEIVVTYTTAFGSDIPPGIYTNYAAVISSNAEENAMASHTIEVTGSDILVLINEPAPISESIAHVPPQRVLGAATENIAKDEPAATTSNETIATTSPIRAEPAPAMSILDRLAHFTSFIFARFTFMFGGESLLLAVPLFFTSIRRKDFRKM